ncbi:MAG: protein transport protein HofC [Enterobacteriaceae bacterium]
MARLYLWQGIDSAGELQQGETLARSAGAAQQQVMQQGCFPFSLKAGQRITRRCWHVTRRIAFIRQLATLLQAGLPLLQSLNLLAEQHDSAPWRYLLHQLQQQVASGVPFSVAIAAFPDAFPPLYQQMIATGELTGFLDLCCLQLAEQQEKELQLRKKVHKALRYPLFVLGATVLVTLLMLQFVLPQFAAIYEDFQAPLPALTRGLLQLSSLLNHYTLPVLCIIPLSVFSYRRWLHPQPRWQSALQQRLLRMPLLKSLLAHSALSRLCTIVAMSQAAGLPLLEGLRSAAHSEPSLPFAQALQEICQQLQQGMSLHSAIRQQPLFPPLVQQLIQIGEESGTLEMMLKRLALTYEQSASELSDKLAQTMEPLLMIVVGTIVGGLVIAMYLPIFQLGQVIG